MQPVIFHDSHNTTYRFPFGAAAAGSAITLRCDVEGDGSEEVFLRLWKQDAGETLFPMERESRQKKQEGRPDKCASADRPGGIPYAAAEKPEKRSYAYTFTAPEAGCLLWYYFMIKANGKTFYYGNNMEQLGGCGQVCGNEPPSFQITVYDRDMKTPSWLKHTVVYQIFPDRFNRGSVSLSQFSGKPGALLHGDWNDRPRYIKDPATGSILNYDFFGGTLEGIREKLDYLKELGVGCLYLNPVFESRSNHHYDTGDYKKIDPFLGTEEEFARLCSEAKERGIRILLDGVFSHTGDDSVYFNREGNYPGTGAFQAKSSPYYSWYKFKNYPEEYACWWGDKSLPEVDETNGKYQDFIIRDKDSVLNHWLNAGINGWRLDVADELPDEFLTAFYRELKKKNGEAALIGEVWEDASNKISYGRQRAYLCGGKLDSVMNYVLRRLMINFLLDKADAGYTNALYMQQMENYPKENLYAMLNLAGSHDVERILSVLGPSRLILFWAWQMTLPGAPCIYYGDEAGLEGGKDPDNRRPYPWGREDKELQSYCRRFVRLRNRYAALRTGRMIPVYAEGDVYVYARSIEGGRDVFGEPAGDGLFFILLNRGNRPHTVRVYTGELAYGELHAVGPDAAGPVSVINGIFTVTLPPVSQQIYRCEEGEPVPADKAGIPGSLPETDRENTGRRKAGILLHPTSLWGNQGREKKEAAMEWIRFLAASGQKIWQILPLNPPGLGNSPYLSASAFAGHETLFAEEGETVDGNGFRSGYQTSGSHTTDREKNYAVFCDKNSYWLPDYAFYRAARDYYGGMPWQKWPEDISKRKPGALQELRTKLNRQISCYQWKQFRFHCAWQEIREYAANNGISILGDMPIFVAPDSADCWAHPEYFYLDGNGWPEEVAGVPPDYFSAKGQIWGNPLYRWDVMEKDGFRWWKERFRAISQWTDMVRVDHFRGFAAAWAIPRGEKDATAGSWKAAKGREMFLALRREMPQLRLVAEDLGQISEDVYQLKKEMGLPGMRILQFHLQNRADGLCDFATEPNCIVYTGTHDNNTLRGWLEEDVSLVLLNQLRGMLGGKDPEVWTLIGYVYGRRAETVIVPAQDILGLPSGCRMNTPGTPAGNWEWRLDKNLLTGALAKKLADLADRYNR